MTSITTETMRCIGGPLDGMGVEVPKGQEELRYTVLDDDLTAQLKASLRVKERGMAVIPTKVAVYRRRRLALAAVNVLPMERQAFIFEEWN